MKKSPVVHFEMPAKDRARVKDFYSKVFGWEMAQLGEEMGNYILAGTVDVDEKRMPKESGAINGGFFDYNENDELMRVPHLVISVENIDKSIKIVEKEGGKIVSPKMEIKGIGTYVTFKDSENNIVGMLQPVPA